MKIQKQNYYELLGVSNNMTCEQIENHCGSRVATLNRKEQKAYNVLTNSEKRKKYDETLGLEVEPIVEEQVEKVESEPIVEEQVEKVESEPTAEEQIERVEGEIVGEENANTNKKNKKKIFGSIAILATVTVVLIGGIFLIKPKGNSKNPTNDKNVTASPTPGLKPEKKPTATPTPEVVPEQKPEEQPVVINPEEVTEINSENIDVMTDYHTKQAAAKGLEVNPDDVRAALLIKNKDSISKEEMEKMVPGLDLTGEYKKASNYSCAVDSHNIINCAYGKDMTKYISISGLCYSSDANITKSLDAMCMYLISGVNDGTLTKEEFDTIFKAVAGFYAETSKLQVGQFEYGYEDLTAGGKYTVEVAIWPQFAVAFTISDYGTDEILKGVDVLGKVAIDGARYLEDLTTYDKVNVK